MKVGQTKWTEESIYEKITVKKHLFESQNFKNTTWIKIKNVYNVIITKFKVQNIFNKVI